jgi:hypothetical protein
MDLATLDLSGFVNPGDREHLVTQLKIPFTMLVSPIS